MEKLFSFKSFQDGSAGGQGTGPSSDRTLNAETPTLNLAHARHVSRHPLPRQARHVPILRANPYPERLFTLETCCGYGYEPARPLHVALSRIFKVRGEDPDTAATAVLFAFQTISPSGMGGDASTLFVDVDASTLFVDVDTSTIRHQCHQMSSMSTMSIKRRHCVNNIDNIGDCNNKCIGGGRCVLEPSMLGCGCLSAPPRDGDEGVQEKGGVQEVYVLGVCKKYGCWVCVCVQEWVLGVCKNGGWGVCARMGVS
ncbi:hypothetical protein GEV33_008252 [Tenebrio molitor]|uniref:Uncharacterized protein n=1 Tax=Tenebrio molitor TaxID=7067 RepID=A0A8J6LAC3_TENMO|nr:hypothetical protein GEV33_008252 [Tenebrio molitor]